MDVSAVVDQIDRALRAGGTPVRAQHDRAYLKSSLDHYGAGVTAIRAVVRATAAQYPDPGHGEIVALVKALWVAPVHDRRVAVVELLDRYHDRLRCGDVALLERLLRESHTWALVDGLAGWIVGRLTDRCPGIGVVLDRWALDQDFWIRRAALLANLVALRRGQGDFERFTRYADAMLEDKEFFIRKAIGWVLRDTAKKRPDMVFRWLEPRAARASGVTIREAVKPLSDEQRAVVLAARRPPAG